VSYCAHCQNERSDRVFTEMDCSMRTDRVLDHVSPVRRIVIEVTFDTIMTRGWYREKTLRSGYLSLI
jgi:hypothetical protein